MIVLAACNSSKKNVDTAQIPEDSNHENGRNADSLFASIERTACFGSCPVYKISIYKDGYVLYQGRQFVEKKGAYKSTLSPEQLEEIKNTASRLGYFEMEDEYVNPALTDFPSCITTLKVNGQRKKIRLYSEAPPEKLVEFQNYLDSLFVDANWILIRKDRELED